MEKLVLDSMSRKKCYQSNREETHEGYCSIALYVKKEKESQLYITFVSIKAKA